MTALTGEQLDGLSLRKNQEFDGEAHLTCDELDALIQAARERNELVEFLRTHGDELTGQLAHTIEADDPLMVAVNALLERFAKP